MIELTLYDLRDKMNHNGYTTPDEEMVVKIEYFHAVCAQEGLSIFHERSPHSKDGMAFRGYLRFFEDDEQMVEFKLKYCDK